MVRQTYRLVLFLLMFAIGYTHADTSHLQNVKFRIVDKATGEPLRNRELNICRFVYFKLKPGVPSPYLRKDADWYITSVVTDNNGIFMLDLSSIEETHIVVEPGKPYYITKFSRTSDLAGTKSIDHVRVTHFHRGLTNRIYDLKRGMVKIIVFSDETTEEPFTEILLTVRKRENELYGEAEEVMLKFQQALQESEWEKALSYCSEKVKAKAKEYESAEAFLRDIAPVEEIIPLSRFQVSGGQWKTKPADERVSFFCFVRLTEPGSSPTISWGWTVAKSDDGWLIDFKLLPLEKWIEEETNRLRREAEEARGRLEELREGIEMRLTALSEEFVIGQPMLFRLQITNVSESPITYDATSSLMVNIPMIVKGPDGQAIAYIDTSYQTWARPGEIQPGQTVVLSDNYDAASQYRIVKPGRYSFQFKGFWGAKPSNIVEIDIKPGELSPEDSIVESLFSILPDGWKLTKTRARDIADFNFETGRGIFISLVGKWGRKGTSGGTVGVFLLINPTQSVLEKTEFEAEFWGQSEWGPVYAKSLEAELLWPNYKEQIMKALNIQEVNQD